jgi:hypothetical protein
MKFFDRWSCLAYKTVLLILCLLSVWVLNLKADVVIEKKLNLQDMSFKLQEEAYELTSKSVNILLLGQGATALSESPQSYIASLQSKAASKRKEAQRLNQSFWYYVKNDFRYSVLYFIWALVVGVILSNLTSELYSHFKDKCCKS